MSDDAPELLNFIDGDFHPSASDHWIDDLAPATGRLIARIPCSGLTSTSGPSHFGPPTAPKSIASALRHSSRVSSGSGVPASSIACPPTMP